MFRDNEGVHIMSIVPTLNIQNNANQVVLYFDYKG